MNNINNNNSKLKTTYIPRGKYDKNEYNKLDIDERTQSSEFLGNFKQNFDLTKNASLNDFNNSGNFMTNYTMSPHPIQYSLEIYEGKFQKKIPTRLDTRQPKFNEINILEDSVNKLFSDIKKDTTNLMISKVEATHNNEIDDKYDTRNNMSQPIRKINEYEFERDQFLYKNVVGVKETVLEYVLYISSADRDAKRYPNPFNYCVEFNPTNTTSNAYISKYFKNIKYYHIVNVIMPNRYYIFYKPINLIYDGDPYGEIDGDMTAQPFVDACLDTPPNSVICNYIKQQGSIVYYGSVFYFTYYEMNIQNQKYYLCTYDIYLDREYKQKTDLTFLEGVDTYNIDVWLNNNDPTRPYYLIPDSYDVYISEPLNPLREVGSWILIANVPTYDTSDQTLLGGKIKFCKQDDYFEELIDQVFEFRYNANNELILDTFNYYILMKSSLQNDRYILLNVPEIETNYEYATDDNLKRSFCILFPDFINGDYYYLDTLNHEKVYDRGLLGNLSRMTIGFKNASGIDLTIGDNIIDYDITTPNTCICGIDNETGLRTRNYQCFHSYMRHQYFEKLQNTIVLKLGILHSSQVIQHF